MRRISGSLGLGREFRWDFKMVEHVKPGRVFKKRPVLRVPRYPTACLYPYRTRRVQPLSLEKHLRQSAKVIRPNRAERDLKGGKPLLTIDLSGRPTTDQRRPRNITYSVVLDYDYANDFFEGH